MKKIPAIIGIICGTLLLAGYTRAQAINVPEGCIAAPDATAGDMDYANKVVHVKTGMELVLIPHGSFKMGGSDVTIAKPFYLGKYTVTNKQYKQFIAENIGYDGAKDCDPGYDLYIRHLRVPPVSIMPSGDNYPIVFVSWKNARAFCSWGAGLDLPSEAEWEYACRAGTTTLSSFVDDSKDVDKYAWTHFNSKATTQPVGQLLPNSWGLYDMQGNVWEWCLDDERPSIFRTKAAPADGSAYTETDESASKVKGIITKVVRGGSWSNPPYSASAALNVAPVLATNDIGFRVVLRLNPR